MLRTVLHSACVSCCLMGISHFCGASPCCRLQDVEAEWQGRLQAALHECEARHREELRQWEKRLQEADREWHGRLLEADKAAGGGLPGCVCWRHIKGELAAVHACAVCSEPVTGPGRPGSLTLDQDGCCTGIPGSSMRCVPPGLQAKRVHACACC